MRLAEGFVVGGRYRIERLVAAGSKFRVYEAEGLDDGPGQVCVKVARHDEVQSLGGLEAGRARVQAEWDVLVRLHEHATSAAPTPIELVRMYPGEAAVRNVAMVDKAAVRREPYLVCELTDGVTLAALLRGELLDDERALLIALRVVLFIRAAREVGLEFEDFSPSNFVVDHAGENVSVVGLTGPGPMPPSRRTGRDAVPVGFGRLLASLLGGVVAPEWGSDEADLPRWRKLLASRRVPREFHEIILGSIGFGEEFPSSLDAVENKIRALVGAVRPAVHDHPARSRDAPYLIAPGERIADRFEVIAPLGQGGRGFVYRARDELSGGEVLFKCNKYVYDSGSAFALELATRRLELEHEFAVLKRFAARTGMLPQPIAIARGLGRGAWFDLAPDLAPGEPFVVMEYVKGIPLLDLLPHPLAAYEGAADPTNRLPPRFVLRLVAQIADLLRRFHEAGFLYQDLKPENVLYDPRAENVFMVDFAGACPRLPDGTLDKSHVAFGVQTHGFAAPEFAERWERSDDRFDIYSLGATAYHLLTGVNPERVALEEGTEYPTLSLRPLQTLPPPVATLVASCLAPHDQRIRTAEIVKRTAEAARLQLSNTRPLDVRQPSVGYTTEGVELRWTLPDDPRIDAIRVRRFSDDEADATVVYAGPPREILVDAELAAEDRTYVIETAYTRAGQPKHGRGRTIASEAYPAAVRFEVQPYFGGNRLRCDVAPHATGLVLRWSSESPPLDVDDGEALDLPRGRRVLHLVAEGTTVHYAAFARYGDTVSMPRYGTATALGALPEPGPLRATQGDDGVALEWDEAHDTLVVLAVEGADGPRRLLPAPGRTRVLDMAARPDSEISYRLVAERGDVVSDTLARSDVLRWPDLPPLSVTPGPGRATVAARGPVHPRLAGFEIGVASEGAAVTAWTPLGELPAAVEVPADQPSTVFVRAHVRGSGVGPSTSTAVVVPPAAVEVGLDDDGASLPLQLRWSLPHSAARWSGEYAFTVSRDGVVIDELAGPIASGFAPSVDGLVRFVRDGELGPAETAWYVARLTAPDGSVLAEVTRELRGLEKLAPPRCEAKLAAVVVAAIDGIERVDVHVARAGDESELRGVRLPQVLAAAEGERVQVRIRRSVSGAPMLWSEPTEIEALARPSVPASGEAAIRPDGVHVSWAPVVLPAVDYVVRDADGVLVYAGVEPRFVDVTGSGSTAYHVAARRHGLESGRLTVPVPGASPRPASTAPMKIRRPQRVRGLRPSHDRLVQCVRVGRTNAIELVGDAVPRIVVVLEGGDDRALDEAVGQLHGPDWLSAPSVAAAHIVLGRRVLVPWRGSGRAVRVVEAPVEVERPSWRGVVSSVEPVRGVLIGAASDVDAVVLWAARGSLDVEESDRLLVYPAAGLPSRLHLRDGRDAPIERIGRDGVEVALRGAGVGAAGVGIEIAARPALLVPAGDIESVVSLRSLVWSDAARGFPLFVAQRLESEWRAPLASMNVGGVSTFHFVREAEPVEVTLGCEVVSARGGARLHVEVASLSGRAVTVFPFSLARPSGYRKLVGRVARWVVRQVADDGPADPIALIA